MAHESLPMSSQGPSDSGPRDGTAPDPREAQFLATEHWSLLATRSLSWSEAFSRSGMFLSTLSAATVALALVGPATDFGPEFIGFALIILSVTLFLGVATFVRLTQVNNEDLYWVAGMNWLRAEYARLVPGIETAFFAGWTLDAPGISRSFAAVDVMSKPSALHMLVTTPAVVGIISSAIAGVMAGLASIQASMGMAPAVGLGAVVFAISVALCIAFAAREGRHYVGRINRVVEGQERRLATTGPGDGARTSPSGRCGAKPTVQVLAGRLSLEREWSRTANDRVAPDRVEASPGRSRNAASRPCCGPGDVEPRGLRGLLCHGAAVGGPGLGPARRVAGAVDGTQRGTRCGWLPAT